MTGHDIEAGNVVVAMLGAGFLLPAIDAVRDALARGAHPDALEDGRGFLHLPLPPEAVRLVLEAGGDPNLADADGRRPLETQPDPASIRILLDAGADPRSCRPLHEIMDAGTARMLLAAGADPEARDAHGRTPLHRAADKAIGGTEILALLLAAGADPRAVDASGRTPLHLADAGDAAFRLIAAGADPLARDARGRTPLHVLRRPAAVAAVVRAGGDPLATDGDGRRPLAVLLDDDQHAADPDTVAHLRTGGAPAEPAAAARMLARFLASPEAMMHDRPDGWIADVVRSAFGAGLDVADIGPDARLDDRGRRLIHLAPDADLTKRMLDAGCDPGARDADGRTALWTAMVPGQIDLLVAAGCPVDVLDRHGGTPLHAARHAACIRRLIAAGVDPDVADGAGRVPLMMAGTADAVRALLDGGADPTASMPIPGTRWTADAIGHLLLRLGSGDPTRPAVAPDVLMAAIDRGCFPTCTGRGPAPTAAATGVARLPVDTPMRAAAAWLAGMSLDIPTGQAPVEPIALATVLGAIAAHAGADWTMRALAAIGDLADPPAPA